VSLGGQALGSGPDGLAEVHAGKTIPDDVFLAG
jgi:hypothetical protein